MKYTKLLLFLVLIVASYSLEQGSAPCQLCHHLVRTFQRGVPRKPTLPLLEKIAVQYCLTKHLQDKKVCVGAIKEMTKFILAGLWKHYTNPHLVCQSILVCSKQYVKRNLSDDVQSMIKDKPTKQWEKPTGRRGLKIMHISDLHPDLFYTEGSPVDCTEPVCCRNNVTSKPNSTRKAGYWGSIGSCDLPIQTFDVFLDEVRRINPDAIIWTGDNTPHDIWQQTQSYNLNFTIMLSEKIRAVSNATVIAAMGNHESWPVNVYDYHSDRESVLNAGLAQAWRYWLDDKAFKMQREKGYYSMTYPNLNNVKVLSVNTQAGNDENWLLLQDPSDPGDTLKWIEEELRASQKIGQMVYIIGHIPPKSNLNDWSVRFAAIVDRYAYIIRGQFYGHTHSDHVSFFPELRNLTNINSAPLSNYYLISPSLTTYSDRIPQFRVMDIDFDTLQVVDFDQYRLDLRKYQTAYNPAKFELFYKFKTAYKISDMTVKGGMTQLRNKLRDDPQTQKTYAHHRCAGLCQGSSGKDIFCDTMVTPQFQTQCNGGTFKKSAFEKAAGPWREWKHKD